jgi:sulfur-carrier protein adenylyltransferase/sulfurtransferase
MNDTDKPTTSNILSPSEIRRYFKQINHSEIGLEGQEKIKQAKVLVIGAGTKGTTVLQNLVTAGVGYIGICDYRAVKEIDLSSQFLYGNGDLGKQKAIISKKKLSEINSTVHIELHNVSLAEQNIDFIVNDYDILIDSTDNFPSRYLISKTAISTGKPVIYGAIFNSAGFVSVFNYENGPSFKCLYPNPPQESDITQLVPVSPLLLGNILGSIMANETLKVIIGQTSLLSGNLLKFNPTDYTITFEKIIRNPGNFS